MFSVLLILLMTGASIWLFYHTSMTTAIEEAKGRHPMTRRCNVCEVLYLPALHPQRIHGDDEQCTICQKKIDRDGWDSHWRLNHIPRATGAEDRADWPTRKDH